MPSPPRGRLVLDDLRPGVVKEDTPEVSARTRTPVKSDRGGAAAPEWMAADEEPTPPGEDRNWEGEDERESPARTVKDDSAQTDEVAREPQRIPSPHRRSASPLKPQEERGSGPTHTGAKEEETSRGFQGFSRTSRKWFDESGYSGCLDRLEELEGIVEAQFKDLSSKGYGENLATKARLYDGETLDLSSLGREAPLKLETLEKLERTVEKQHDDLIDKGVLPGDSLRIFPS